MATYGSEVLFTIERFECAHSRLGGLAAWLVALLGLAGLAELAGLFGP